MTAPNILTKLIQLAGNVGNAFTSALFLADPVEQTLQLKHFHSLSQAVDPHTRLAFGEGPIGQVAALEQPILQEHFTQDSSVLKLYRQPEDLKGFMAVPVKSDYLLGVLALDTKESYSFSVRTQKIIGSLADLMAWHLNHDVKEIETSDPDRFPIRELTSYSQAIADSMHPAAMAEQLSRIPSNLLQFDAMAVVWIDEEQTKGKVVCHQGWNEDVSNWEIVPGKGIAGSTIKNLTSTLISNLPDHRSVVLREEEQGEDFQSILSAPVIFKTHLLAILVCASRRKNEFTRSHLDVLNMLSAFSAPALFYAKEKRQWDYDKNLDQVTGIPNHRCLVAYRENIEKEVLRGRRVIFFLSIHLKNLLSLYEAHGVVLGDQLLKQVVSMLSKVVPSPKFLFKYSDSSFLIILLKDKWQELEVLEAKLRHLFDKTPFFVEGHPMALDVEMGWSSFPEDGGNLCELAGISWARSSQKSGAMHGQKLAK
tara:strand:- start:1267 stop:2706 length:1440 start_codon:yes stop_codon:yes gene_type:complete